MHHIHTAKKKLLAIVLLFIVIVAILIIIQPKNCNSDLDCFHKATLKCSKAKVTALKDGSTYNYQILGDKKDNCIIKVTLLSMSLTQSADLKKALEGRSMTCSVSKEYLETNPFNDIRNLNDYCTGPLKEATLEITIDQMYELIVQNIGPIVADYKGTPVNSS